jgi:transcriptional regulator with XRE-family HTH domain
MPTPSSLLRETRRLAGLSQRELADRAGTSQSAIARLESGRGSVTVSTRERLLAAAGFDLVLDVAPPARTDDALTAVYRQDVDRSLLRQNLRRSVDERLRSGAELVTAGHELQRAMASAPRRRADPR